MRVTIRELKRDDAQALSHAFSAQGWNKPESLFLTYYTEQNQGKRKVFVAEFDGELLGYVTVLPFAKEGPYKGKKIPQIVDFNVLEIYRKNGVGTKLLDEAEKFVFNKSDKVVLGVGLHKGYGPAQRLYVKRGYIPDGTGVWYRDVNIGQKEFCINDDDLLLYLCKELKSYKPDY